MLLTKAFVVYSTYVTQSQQFSQKNLLVCLRDARDFIAFLMVVGQRALQQKRVIS